MTPGLSSAASPPGTQLAAARSRSTPPCMRAHHERIGGRSGAPSRIRTCTVLLLRKPPPWIAECRTVALAAKLWERSWCAEQESNCTERDLKPPPQPIGLSARCLPRDSNPHSHRV